MCGQHSVGAGMAQGSTHAARAGSGQLEIAFGNIVGS